MPAVLVGGDADLIHGGTGNDKLLGGGGSDTIYGDDGNDSIEGGTGADTLYGGADNDTILGGSDPDKLYGDAGNDVLEGGQGNDKVYGGAGVDSLIAGYGSDILDGEGDSDQYLINARGGNTTELTTVYDSGGVPTDTDLLTVLGTGQADVFLLRAMADTYFPKVDKKLEPALERAFIKIDLLDDDEARHELIRDYIMAAYGPHEAPQAMLDALDAVDLSHPQALNHLKAAVAANYVTELTALGSDTDTAFVALLNNGGATVERFNYRNIEGLVLNTVGGADLVVTDDVTAATTINLGTGDDRVQVGQVFRSERVVSDPPLITNIAEDDVFMTIEITRGWLSNGVSVATTVNGGDGNDEFTVFHNIAVLNLNGGDGDDLFTVRAFALAGSTDSERGRTDMKGDAGADTILYAMNAPVGIDGGDGFDTVRIIGTEFADDFVVTDSGVFGAGLNVSYANIEKLVADGAEGDDRFFVLSTGIEVVTELDGGLGSDSFFVGGSPSDAPIPVTSNDFKGHSGIILHSIETGDPAYQGLAIDGVSANVADNEEDFIIVTPSGGVSRVTEGATSGGVGWEYDTYTVRLTREPDSGKQVIINIVPAALPPEDEAKGFRDLEFYDPNSLGDLLPYVNGKQLLPVLIFNSGAGWDAPKTIKFRAVNDTGMEGTRQVFINHTTSNSTDALYSDAKMLSVKVQINDDDRAGVIITPSGTGNTVLEGGFTDTFDVVLTRQPSANVTVNLGVTNSQVSLSQTSLTFSANSADANAWNKKQTITITAINDSTVEGFHTDFITYTVVSTDVDLVQPQALYTVDGDPDRDAFNDGLPDDIPPEKPLSYLFLSQRPLLDQAIQIKYDADGDGGPGGFVNLAKYTNQTDSVLRYSITGNTLEFFRNGAPASISGTIQASFFYNKPGYNGALVKDTSIDIYDNDAPGVIITQTDGSTDVIEGGSASTYDTYTVMLTKAPSGPTTITIDSVNTRTTLDGFARFQEQVEVSTDGTTFHSVVFLTFTAANAPQTIWVRARHDTVLDGSDTQVFAPEAHTVSKIRGPLVIEGAAGAGSLSLPAPLMLPGEVNLRPSDGAVQAFTAGTGEGAFEFMNVRKEDLQALINDDTKDFDALADFIDKTLELTEGPGTGVVLDSTRPRDLFDRFWLIKEIQAVAGNSNIWRLKLQNPSMVDPGLSNVIAPVATQTKFAITNLSVNFFVDEKQSVDYTTIFDEDAVAARTGRLTSADGNVLSYNNVNNTMVIETADLQALAKLLGIVNLNTGFVNKKIEITVGNGIDRVWTINTVTDGAVAGTKVLGLINVSGSGTPDARSEYRIEGGDRKGRITGFGMGPNVVIGNGVQPGGISYGDMEVLLMSLGSGNDTVIVDYTTNSEDHTTKRDGDFYTLTTLNTGGGNDNITIELQDGDDGALALNTEAGNDTATATGSLGIVMFGGLGNDTLTGGTGEDIIFGDTGRVDYLSNTGEIVTRLGHTVPQSPVNPPVAAVVSSATSNTVSNSLATFTPGSLVGFKIQVTGPNGQAQLRTITANTATQITVDSAWTALPTTDFFYRILFQAANVTIDGVQRATLTDALGNFETAYGGLVGLGLQVISPDGHVQFRQIISNTATQLVLDKPWDTVPVSAGPANINFFYRVASYPEDQTDGVIRGPRVAWSINDSEGGNDTVNGGSGRDLLIGGAGNDVMHGNDGIDFMIGDGGRFDFVPVTGDDGPTILSTVQATAPGIGGVDTMHGDAGNDVLIGGAAGDNISGDANQDILLGDQGLVTLVNGNIVYIQDPGTPGDDWLTGGDDFDLIIGGLGNDKISGLGGADILIGDEGEVFLALDGITITKIDTNTLNPGQGGTDTIFGGDNDDIIIGGANDDRLDGGNDRDLIFGDNVTLNRSAGSGNAIDPRFRTLLPGATIYGLDGSAQVNLAFDAIVPAIGRPAWGADWTITLDQTLIASHFGNDYIAGGAHDDEIFGQLGDDTIQGDGTIGPVGGTVPANFIMPSMTFALAAGGNLAVALPTAYGATRSGTLTVVSSFEGTNDGDDYIEGNGGKDVIFGNLGQDDIIGGSSDLFSLTTSSLRPDDADIIFGGAGADYSRNNLGDAVLNGAGDTIVTAANGHSRDADMILGDNGDIFRLVSVNGASAYLGFTYDDLYGGTPIIPRAAKLLDYTPGGPDFSAAANSDIGAADEIHGESGDDFIYGMKGADVLFGDGQDDDIIGGYGNDWISGGTGDDGVVGDDGRIYTSRNGLTENLYGIAATTQTEISTPGKMQVATINVTGQLKKTVNLTPFSVDPSWPAVNTIDEFGGPDTAATHPTIPTTSFMEDGATTSCMAGRVTTPSRVQKHCRRSLMFRLIRATYSITPASAAASLRCTMSSIHSQRS
jgi:Ca2+-binding RTX toxin-like protein